MNDKSPATALDKKVLQQRKIMKNHLIIDGFFVGTTAIFAWLVLLTLLSIIVFLFVEAYPSIKEFGLSFITHSEWDVGKNQFGALSAIYGTIITSLIAIIIAVPISAGIAIFLTELCPSILRKPIGSAIQLLAGIPSIVYGIWGFMVFAPFFLKYVINPLGLGHLDVNFLTAGIILAIMIIPFIASVMRDVIETVPKMLKESAYGLGATRWEVLKKVVFPYASTGVVGGIILGLGRALGETMAVTYVIGNTWSLNFGLTNAGQSITSAIANEFNEANDLQRSSLMFLAVVLMIISVIVLSLSKVLLSRSNRFKK